MPLFLSSTQFLLWLQLSWYNSYHKKTLFKRIHSLEMECIRFFCAKFLFYAYILAF